MLGHANLGTTSIYLQGIDTEEIIATIHARRAPMMSATAGLQLSVTRLPERGSAAHAPQALKRASASRTKASVMKTRPGLPVVPGDRPQRASGAGARRCSLARAKGKRFRWCAVHCRSA